MPYIRKSIYRYTIYTSIFLSLIVLIIVILSALGIALFPGCKGKVLYAKLKDVPIPNPYTIVQNSYTEDYSGSIDFVYKEGYLDKTKDYSIEKLNEAQLSEISDLINNSPLSTQIVVLDQNHAKNKRYTRILQDKSSSFIEVYAFESCYIPDFLAKYKLTSFLGNIGINFIQANQFEIKQNAVEEKLLY